MFVLEHFANDFVTSCAQFWVLRHFEWPKLGAKWELGEKFIHSLRISSPQAEESVAMCQQCLSTNRMLRQPLSGGRSEFCNEGLAFSRALRDVAVREPITRSSSDLAAQLREVLASIQVGHLTNPEVTEQGLQMFALCDKKESKTDSPLKSQVRQELFAKRYSAEAQKYLDEIRKQAMIEYK